MSVLVYDCGSVENTVTAILDTESGAMIIRGNGDVDNYADESSPWYSEHSDIIQVTVDKGITRIGSGTFYGCENLSFIEIASTVTSIGADVFQNCTLLTRIKIPKSITDIGNGTFADSGLTEVKFYGNPPTVGTDIFDGVTADVYTPEGNEEWTETAKGTVAGNGSNLTWKEFDSKPSLIEYDELDYLWSKIKKYVDNNVSVTQVVSSGTKIATITINGVDTDIYSSPFSGTIGDSTTPIYIDNGVPTACGGSLAVDITGNAATATTASACSGNAATATDSTTVKELNGNSNYNRPVLLSGLTNITTTTDHQTTPVYSNKFYANPSTGVQTATGGFSSSGSYTTSLTTSTHLAGNKGTAIINSTAAKGYTMLARMKSTNGVFCHGVYNGDYQFYYTADSVISANTNSVTKTCLTINENGTVSAPNGFVGNVTGNCSGSSGSCTGNAATATSATKSTQDADGNDIRSRYMMVYNTNNYGQSSSVTFTNLAAAGNAVGMINAATDNPRGSAGWVHAISLCWTKGTTSSWISQIAMSPTDGTGMWYRTTNGNIAGKAWTRVLDSGNYTSYTVKKDGTGASGSWGISVTGSSASCTGNAASATYATNIRVTDTDSNTWYPLVFSTGSAASTNYAARVDADSILVYPGTSPAANTQGNCYLQLGNGKAKATAGNKRGVLRIYGTGTSYTEITSAVASTARSISFPDKAGTVALTSDITAANIGYSEIATIISSATAKSVSNGWLKIGNVLINWGMVKYTNRGACDPSDTITFTKAYATNFIPSVILTGTRHSAGDGFIKGIRQDSVTNTSFKLAVDAFNSGAGFNNIQQLYWIAIGKG